MVKLGLPAFFQHPARNFARKLYSGEPLDDADHAAAENLMPASSSPLGEVLNAAEVLGSAAVGVLEGGATRIGRELGGRVDEVLRAGPNDIGRVAARMLNAPLSEAGRRTTKYLALTDVLPRPDDGELRARVQEVVARAAENKLFADENRLEPLPLFDLATTVARALLGLNRGPDTITEICIGERQLEKVADGSVFPEVEMEAFDQAGHHVLSARVASPELGALFVYELVASHGRNVEDFAMAWGGSQAPGRGNAIVVARALEVLIVEGVKHGLYAVVTEPASPRVEGHYRKMGFTPPCEAGEFRKPWLTWAVEQVPLGPETVDTLATLSFITRAGRARLAGDHVFEAMQLALTSKRAVEQALGNFQRIRARVTDVPKGVEARLQALNVPFSAVDPKAARRIMRAGEFERKRTLRLPRVAASSPSMELPSAPENSAPPVVARPLLASRARRAERLESWPLIIDRDP